MEHRQNESESEFPFYPSGYSPEVEESDSGYEGRIVELEKSHLGPIPSPEDLDYYKQILPDAPDRILRMAELNAQSFRDLNSRLLEGQILTEQHRHSEVSIGQKSGLYAVGIMAAVAVISLILNHPIVAGTICSSTIIGVAAVFVTGRKSKQQNESPADENQS